MKKNYTLALLTLSLISQPAFATHTKSLFEELTCDSKSLTIRPLVPEEYEEAKTLDQSDHSFLELFPDDEDAPLDEGITDNSNLSAIKKTSTILKDKTLAELSIVRQEIPNGVLYFGVFSKETSTLAGTIKFSGFQSDWMDGNETVKHLLGTDVKFHKNTQGKGYASDAYQTVFNHFKALKLIPESGQESKDAHFLGVHALIHLTNKASLKCLAFNSSAKIGRLFGDRVEVYYPLTPTFLKDHEYMPVPDENLDKEIRPLFTNYLSRDPLQSELAEKEIYATSFQKLLSVAPSDMDKALDDESSFFVRALGKFPHLFDLVDPSLLPILNRMITEMEDTIPLKETIPPEMHQKFDEMIEYIGQVRKKLPRADDEKHEEDTSKENDQEERKQETLNEVIDRTTAENQTSSEELKSL